MALQRERRKRRSDRRGRGDNDRVINLEEEDQDQARDQKDRAQKDRDRKEPDQEDQARDQKDRDQEDQARDQKDRDQEEEDQGRERQDRRPEPLPALEVLEAAKDQLTTLTGRVAESVSGVTRSDNGWRTKIDLVDLERIPPSTSIMATYAVELDREGNVVGYEQERRYLRGQADD